ncbi:unnamed protein product, partial [Amoebophrya sp. A25]
RRLRGISKDDLEARPQQVAQSFEDRFFGKGSGDLTDHFKKKYLLQGLLHLVYFLGRLFGWIQFEVEGHEVEDYEWQGVICLQSDGSCKGKEKKTASMVYVLVYDRADLGYRTFMHPLPLQRPAVGVQGGQKYAAAGTKIEEMVLRLNYLTGDSIWQQSRDQ